MSILNYSKSKCVYDNYNKFLLFLCILEIGGVLELVNIACNFRLLLYIIHIYNYVKLRSYLYLFYIINLKEEVTYGIKNQIISNLDLCIYWLPSINKRS